MPKSVKPYSAFLPIIMLIAASLACDFEDASRPDSPPALTESARQVLTAIAADQTAGVAATRFAKVAVTQTAVAAAQTAQAQQATATPTPTATSTPTPAPTLTPTPTLSFEQALLLELEEDLWKSDERGDGLDCRSGAAATVPLPPELDLTGAAAANDPRDPDMIFALSLGTTVAQSGPFAGGVQFYDPTRPLVQDPSWLFNRTGNVSFKFEWDPSTEQIMTIAYRVSPAGVWEQIQTNHRVEFVDYQDGSAVIMAIPEGEVPPGSTWFGHVDNSAVCEHVGLGPDNLPALSLPDNP